MKNVEEIHSRETKVESFPRGWRLLCVVWQYGLPGKIFSHRGRREVHDIQEVNKTYEVQEATEKPAILKPPKVI